MSKVKSFQLIMIAMVVLFLFPLIGQTNTKDTDNQKGPDVITINLPAESYGDEMPSVDFLHSLHNQAADSKCDQCHVQKEDTLVFKFKRSEGTASMELYHDNCIACHLEKNSAGKKSGPLAAECRSCHGVSRTTESSWKKIDFDKSLHYVHETSKEIKSALPSETDNCSACHHKYNAKTKQTYYVKGEEESCTYCHKDTDMDGIRSLRGASHDACVACHTRLKNKDIAAGPTTCNGCHDVNEQAKIKPVKDITRLKRNQPDETMITGWLTEGDNPKYLMNPVAFNHKLHESKTDSCTACHHDTLKKCSDCHTPKGDVSGKFIRLEQAMHDKGSNFSCVGCHKEMTKQSDCAGCHGIMPEKQLSDQTCATCHNSDSGQIPPDADARKALAGKIVSSQSGDYSIVQIDKIPEKVIIGGLADEYKPSEFPHRQVVTAIAERVEKTGMAKIFHKDQQTLCMGCHHNSPKSLEPPKCASCHGKDTDIMNGKPHLKGAYHGQCIACHQKMEVKKVLPTDCNKCHEKK